MSIDEKALQAAHKEGEAIGVALDREDARLIIAAYEAAKANSVMGEPPVVLPGAKAIGAEGMQLPSPATEQPDEGTLFRTISTAILQSAANPSDPRSEAQIILDAIIPLLAAPKRESSDDLLIRNLAMLCARMSRRLVKLPDSRVMAEKAMEFLVRHNLQGSPLRNEIEDREPA